MPALSGLLARIGTAGLDPIDAIYIHMATGNRLPKKTATIASFLYSVGQPFHIFRDGRWQMVRGWSEPRDGASALWFSTSGRHLAGLAVGCFGLMLSAAALMDSANGMFWSNVLLVPSILFWLAGVALV